MRTVIKHFILTAPVKFVLSIIEKFSIKASSQPESDAVSLTPAYVHVH